MTIALMRIILTILVKTTTMVAMTAMAIHLVEVRLQAEVTMATVIQAAIMETSLAVLIMAMGMNLVVLLRVTTITQIKKLALVALVMIIITVVQILMHQEAKDREPIVEIATMCLPKTATIVVIQLAICPIKMIGMMKMMSGTR